MNYNIKYPENNGGMNDRIKRLRQQNFDTPTTLSIERALIETAFYKENYGTMPIAILRARNFYEICKKKTLYIGDDELIVGERGPLPKAVPTFPELTCHSVEDLHTLNERELQRYTISQEDIDTYEREVIPYWQGKTQRERIFNHVSKEWEEAYHAGVFTEFMEQRAAGHTAMDGKMYHEGQKLPINSRNWKLWPSRVMRLFSLQSVMRNWQSKWQRKSKTRNERRN